MQRDEQVVRSGKIFGWLLAIFSMTTAPLLMQHESIFAYLQKNEWPILYPHLFCCDMRHVI